MATKIEALLKEDKAFTKNELTNFPVQAFDDMDKALLKLDQDELTELKRNTTDVTLQENPDCVYAKYVSGRIKMMTSPQDEPVNLVNLLITFYENRNWKAVEYLCEKILSQNENSSALRMLADCYDETGRQDEKWPIYVRIVKVDYSERDIPLKLAEHYEETKNSEKAVSYYKRTLSRCVSAKEDKNLEKVWEKLLKLDEDDFGYFIGMSEKVSVKFDAGTAISLLNSLLQKVASDVDKSIKVLKKELEIDSACQDARSALIVAYQKKYASASRLKECIEKSGLKNSDVQVMKAIDQFESDIAFEEKSFVYMRSNNRLGVIRSITADEVEVSFGKETQKMSAEMAFKALSPLPKTHIRVLKAAVAPEKLKAKIQADTRWALRIILESHEGGQCSFKDMKNDLVPKVLDEKEFDAFRKNARKVLMEDSYFSAVPKLNDTYMIRSTPITSEEKQLNVFRDEKDFFKKIKISNEFLSAELDTESDSFAEIVAYFNGILSSWKSGVTVPVVASYLYLSYMHSDKKIPSAVITVEVSGQELYGKIPSDKKVAYFDMIDNADLKKAYLDIVQQNDKSWPEIYKKCFPHYTYAYIPEKLKSHKMENVYIDIIRESAIGYRDSADVFLWAEKNASEKDWAKAGYGKNDRLIVLMQLLSHLSSCIALKKEVTENKKRLQDVNKMLFEDKSIYKAIDSGDEAFASKVYSIIASDKHNPGRCIEIKHRISEKFPDFKFFDNQAPIDTENLIPTGFLCTKRMLEEKIKEKDNIEHVELKKVAEEIAFARSLGDLRENSEYQYGKDKQKNLNAQLRTLQGEIERAQVVSPESVDPSKVSFGTKVTLLDNKEGKDVVYTILGQWESVPERNILNFKTPFAMKLMNATVGKNLKFEINGTSFDLTVKGIEVAKF